MKLKSIIQESKDTLFFTEHPEFFLNLLKAQKECSRFFGLMYKQKKCFIRASNNIADTYFRKPYGTKRKPKDNPKFNDQWIEEYRVKYYSQLASRQKGSFAEVSDMSKRKIQRPYSILQYGTVVYFVIPKNGAKTFQNPRIKDFIGSTVNNLINDYKHDKENQRTKDLLKKSAEQYFQYGVVQLSKMVPEREVVIESKGYYAFNSNTWTQYCLEILEDNMFEMMSPQHMKRIKESM